MINDRIMIVDKTLLDALMEQAMVNPRKRQALDMRTSANDTSRRMLNAMLPGTVVNIDKHDDTDESIICISGRMDVIIYEEEVDYHFYLSHHYCLHLILHVHFFFYYSQKRGQYTICIV